MLMVLGVTALMWWGFYQQIILGEPWGDNPGPDWFMWLFWLLFGIGLPAFFWWMSMVVEVWPDHVQIHYRPLAKRSIPFSDIERIQARSYSPVKEYGGWGLKGWSSKKMAYNVSGNQGVELFLKDGPTVMIGSQKSQELALAIEVQMQDQRLTIKDQKGVSHGNF